jgi:hypothetical protein
MTPKEHMDEADRLLKRAEEFVVTNAMASRELADLAMKHVEMARVNSTWAEEKRNVP